MANKMLIDAAHPEETRVVVLRGSRVEEFDFESADKRQLRGNIYLAKVTRVEPSLQAAFVDYGGNRHGFLAFSEIHPDYYQIPVSDRQALLEADAEEAHEEEEERKPRRSRRRRGSGDRHAAARRPADESVSEDAEHDESDRHEHGHQDHAGPRGDIGRQDPHDHQDHDLDPAHAAGEAPAPEAFKEPVAPQVDGEVRPVQLAAEQTPPYDDPTADLIQHASAKHAEAAKSETETTEPSAPEAAPSDLLAAEHATEAAAAPAVAGEPVASDADIDTGSTNRGARDHEHHEHEAKHHDAEHHDDEDSESDDEEEEDVEHIGGDALEEVPRRAYRPRRQYKIQEVIKRRQVLLVQVVKEERGNKGAALTTYLSLAGRYSVLMPNTARGGGISRKITDAEDRQRLKSIAQALEVPDGMGVILRTAGAARSTPEVKRDFEYLMRMWETVRETTLGSSAPTLVYEEGSLIKRAIRDLYNKDVEEVVVSGEEGYREAKEFMRLLMPSHAKNVQPWRDPAPIFTKAGADAQLDAMFSSQVTLKSGGYIVINQTEALVAIDVNSGRSTREHNIEDTALRTNLEAADEVARQLRLRDLAGLIVVDFIDMEENRNNRAVERRIKDALKNDRARIQVGRISHFGLLEMSRQRIRTGVLEGSTVMCEHCAGSGMVRSTSSIALHVLRLIEDSLIQDASRNLIVRARSVVALYVLNHKRSHLADLEARFGAAIAVVVDDHLTGTTYCGVERGEPATGIPQPVARQIPINVPEPEDIVEDETQDEDEGEGGSGAEASNEGGEDGRRKRRRRRGRGRDRESSGISHDAPQPADDALSFIGDVSRQTEPDGTAEAGSEESESAAGTGEGQEDAEGGNRRRRSRRGGRRARESRERAEARTQGDGAETSEEVDATHEDAHATETQLIGGEPSGAPLEPAPVHAATNDTAADHAEPPHAVEALAVEAKAPEPEAPEAEMPAQPAAPVAAEAPAEEAPAAPKRPAAVSSEIDPTAPKRSGWWQRAKATLGG